MQQPIPAAPAVAIARPATTVLLVRNRTSPNRGASGIEVFMVQRHRKSGFLPSAWVFPGGRVDDGDWQHGNANVRGRLTLPGLSEVGAAAYGVAAVRETFEEAGIWLGGGAPTNGDREALIRGEIAVGALLERGATVQLDRLRPWSWWITPLAEPKRFDTRFLAAIAEGQLGQHDDQETVDSRWVDPREALALDAAAFPVAPPTWWTLRELATHRSAQAVFDAAVAPAVPVQPVMHFDDHGITLLLPGHPDHGAPPIDALPDRITYERGWVAWQGDERLPAVPDLA